MPRKSKLQKSRILASALGTEAIKIKTNDHIKGNYT
jgi:hypothetical protein